MSEKPTVAIHGIEVTKGEEPPLRLELTQWSSLPENAIQVSLFIRALNKLQDTPHTETLSYFQIAGIHGYPGDLRWDNAPPPTNERKDWSHFVYCTHNAITFPTWHRPYMLLYEQTLHANMIEIIREKLKFQDDAEKQLWLEKANTWRLPYWDWALPTTGASLPALFLLKELSIKDPGSGESKVRNPLYRFQLMVGGKPTKMGDLEAPYKVDNVQGGDDKDPWDLPWKDCSGTSRWSITGPNDIDKWTNGESNPEKVRAAIESRQYYIPGENGDDKDPLGIRKHTISDLVYRLLVSGYVKTWREFSSTAYTLDPPPDWTGYLSLEYIHNNMHGFIGGEDLTTGVGHMQSVPVAAFDPIFYMHHCNIDRQFAIWQTLNPDSWFTDEDKTPGATTTLSPFHMKDEQTGELRLFTSNDVRSWRDYGYDYDTLVRQGNETDDERIMRVKRYLDTTYNVTSQRVLDAAASNSHIFGSTFEKKYGSDLAEDLNATRKYPDYMINILYDRYALGGDPYTIHFFLGKREDVDAYVRPQDHITAQHPYHFGSVFSFSAAMRDGETEYCANCVTQHELGQMSTAQIPFTTALLVRARDDNVTSINTIGHTAVVNYLKDHLHWRALDIKGNEISKEKLQRTKIFVLQGTAEHYQTHDEMSHYDYSKAVPLYEVTAGRRLGGEEGDYEHPAASLNLTQ